jgi:hypothetical protein
MIREWLPEAALKSGLNFESSCLCTKNKPCHGFVFFQQELIYFTFSRQGTGEHTVNLSLLLQRCNEVQLWVATEILLCSQLGKRVQLVKKFIKIAAQ